MLASVAIVWRAIVRLAGNSNAEVHAEWYALVVIGVVIVIDIFRTVASSRAARRYGSVALSSNALHFASDLAGSVAVLVGLLLVRAGYANADSIAALFVAGLVLVAAVRLMRRNVDVLMDRVPADEEATARRAIAAIEPPVELRRLRMRQAAGRYFADVVIGVSFEQAVGQGHAAADQVEQAVQSALPEADVVVHVEPGGGERPPASARTRLRSPSRAFARSTTSASSPSTRASEVSLHIKLPGELHLDEAHAIAEEVEAAIRAAAPEVSSVQTHLEPLAEESAATRPPPAVVAGDIETVARIVRRETGRRSGRAPLPRHGRGARRVPDASRRRHHAARRRPRRGEPGRGADPPRASRDLRRDRAHGAVKLCMFSPVELDLERGWPGRIDGDRVIQLAAQTLQSFFTGGGGAREHAEYPLDGVVLRAPVLHPPSVRIFDEDGDFRFATRRRSTGRRTPCVCPTVSTRSGRCCASPR